MVSVANARALGGLASRGESGEGGCRCINKGRWEGWSCLAWVAGIPRPSHSCRRTSEPAQDRGLELEWCGVDALACFGECCRGDVVPGPRVRRWRTS